MKGFSAQASNRPKASKETLNAKAYKAYPHKASHS
jgi:hypothetical protein